MRVAYRRDYIKLRNRSNKTKPLVEYLRLSFSLIGWCSWIELTKGQARVRTSLIYYYYASTTSAGMPSTLGSQGDRPPVIIILRHH